MPNLRDAIRVMRAIGDVAREHGYIAALYGSTLTNDVIEGPGRDIDIMMVPWREGADARRCWMDLRAVLGAPDGYPVDAYTGTMGTLSVQIHSPIGLVDIQFREVNTHPTQQYYDGPCTCGGLSGFHQPGCPNFRGGY